MAHLSIIAELCKPRLSAAAALSAAAVYVLAGGGFSRHLFSLFSGVLLTAGGACALNEYQERAIDALMDRTKDRPLPSGRLKPAAALLAAGLISATGLIVLYRTFGIPTVLLAGLALFWYNGVYTPLKKTTAFAVVPGALIGALPPAMGWAAAGLPLADPRLLALCFFFGVWQVPHFWLLLSGLGVQYERAGLPSLNAVFTPRQLARLTSVWMCATSLSALLLPLFRVIESGTPCLLLAASAGWLAYNAAGMLDTAATGAPSRRMFMHINVFALLIMLCLFFEPFVASAAVR